MSKTMKLPVLSLTAAYTVNQKLKNLGIPTIDRVLIAVSNKEFVRESGLIIPGGNKEDVPRKGTVVQKGPISSDYRHLDDIIQIGSVVTYGNYAGKKVEPIEVDGFDLMVLSITEICYIEKNLEEPVQSEKSNKENITQEQFLEDKGDIYKDIYLRSIRVMANTLDLYESDIHPYSIIDRDMGADSLDIIELTMNLEKEFAISIPDMDVANLENHMVVTIVEYLYKRLN